MKNSLLHLLVAALVLGGDFALFSLVAAPQAQAYPVRYYHRGPVERQVDRGVVRRTVRRTTRRVVRRHMIYGLPYGYRPYAWGGYSYYVAGSSYYYPYMYGGRTVYVIVEVDSYGRPLPPPAIDEIEFY